MSIVETMRRNAAIRLTTQCLHCQCYIPFVECIAMNDIDETANCKLFKVMTKMPEPERSQ